MNPNHKVVDDFRKDDSGNVIGCPHCGARAIRKDGFNYSSKEKKQMWHCNACGKKTIKPTIVESAPFTVDNRDPDMIPIEDIISFRTKQYSQKLKSKETKKLVNIKIHADGPIGIAHFGDPHVDDDGTDLSQIIN